jgi:hypothetical protein
MLILIALGAAYRLFTKYAAQHEDRPCLVRYVLLLIALALITVYTPLK